MQFHVRLSGILKKFTDKVHKTKHNLSVSHEALSG